mmetsp:Transcript_2529/g.6260  ORF Transcript_2529/g.6260 Transcript_2529/m.6260 type:complete len:120 (+) Transcript_2529:301-660(+)
MVSLWLLEEHSDSVGRCCLLREVASEVGRSFVSTRSTVAIGVGGGRWLRALECLLVSSSCHSAARAGAADGEVGDRGGRQSRSCAVSVTSSEVQMSIDLPNASPPLDARGMLSEVRHAE